jgi:sulfonate transport system ATP-binding protein
MTPAVLRRIDTAVDFESSQVTAMRQGLAISIHDLQKSFGDNHVLKGIDIDVPAGQFVAIVGRSGCGKSTLLRLLLGLDTPSGGSFVFQDGAQPVNDPRVARVMFQEPRLLPWASVLSNVEVGLGPQRNAPGARERALATLRAVDLEAKRDEWPAVLSGGQKQRVALARALVSRPRILALDEPFGALDALTRMTMQKLLARVWHDQKFTALLVTHDVAEAVTLADRVLIIEDGRVTLDLRITLPHPRERGSPEVAALEGRILRDLFRSARSD